MTEPQYLILMRHQELLSGFEKTRSLPGGVFSSLEELNAVYACISGSPALLHCRACLCRMLDTLIRQKRKYELDSQ